MKCMLSYQLTLSLFSHDITFGNNNFIMISSETKTYTYVSEFKHEFKNLCKEPLLFHHNGSVMPDNDRPTYTVVSIR